MFLSHPPGDGESEPIGANRWHRRSENGVVGAPPPLGTLMIPQNISHFHLVFPPARRYTGRRRPGRRAPVKNSTGEKEGGDHMPVTRAPFGVTGDGQAVEVWTLTRGGAGSRDLDLRGRGSGPCVSRTGTEKRWTWCWATTPWRNMSATAATWGPLVGRYANRIAKARCLIDGAVVPLEASEGGKPAPRRRPGLQLPGLSGRRPPGTVPCA